MRNDAIGALAALRKGSSTSPELQRLAMDFVVLARNAGVDTVFLHAPGADLIRENIDAASRSGAIDLHGPAVTPAARQLIHQRAESVGWRISVDLFATKQNAICPRFFARFAEPDAEGQDALAQADWNSSRCPRCGESHREISYAFPPAALVAQTLRKAVADRSQLLLLVPYPPSAAYWPRVTGATIAGDGLPLLVFSNPAASLSHVGAYNPGSLALFALDFNQQPDADSTPHAAPCGQESGARPPASWESTLDKADRGLIRIALWDAIQRTSAQKEDGPPQGEGRPRLPQ